jgi:hypothetical protein
MMTSQQRSEAARKAAASRRANRAAGTTGTASPNPKPNGRTVLNQWRTVATISQHELFADAALQALAKLEDALVLRLGQKGHTITDDQRKAFDRYQKVKALALGGIKSTNETTRNEALLAMRMAAVDAVKLVF